MPPIPNSPRPVIWFALGGIVIGLSLYTYSTARFAPFVIVALALYVPLLHRRLLRQALPGLVLALILTTLIFLPEGLFFLSNPASFLDRAQEVTIVNPALQKGDLGQTYARLGVHSLGMFAIRGDSNWPQKPPGPANFRSAVGAIDGPRDSIGHPAIQAAGIRPSSSYGLP